jgi:hypothetical protein
MAPLNAHAQQLYEDLGRLAEGEIGRVGQALADVYNTLLSRAKESFPEDALIGVLKPVAESTHPRVVQALAAQLRLVLGNA